MCWNQVCTLHTFAISDSACKTCKTIKSYKALRGTYQFSNRSMSIIISLNLHRTKNQQTNFAYNPTQYIYMCASFWYTTRSSPDTPPVKNGCFIVLLVSRKSGVSFHKNSITLMKWTFLPLCKKWCAMSMWSDGEAAIDQFQFHFNP